MIFYNKRRERKRREMEKGEEGKVEGEREEEEMERHACVVTRVATYVHELPGHP